MPFEVTEHIPSNRERVPAATTPMNRPYRVALAYKNMRARGSGHIGLGVTAAQTCKYLIAKGIYTDPWGVNDLAGLQEKIALARKEPPGIQPITHVVISAPWLPSADLQDFALANPSIDFTVTCHSNIPFLAADPNAFRLIREYMYVETITPNFHLAGNSARLNAWVTKTYGFPCWTIPNLYYVDANAVNAVHRAPFSGDMLRIGCFGATRILKNILTAGAAALQLARSMRVDLEFWVSTGRDEGPQGTMASLYQMFNGIKWAAVRENRWEEWPAFRTTVEHMDLLMQPSFTETFNVVTADGCASGVPSVTGPAIEWVPGYWQAPTDDPEAIANTAEAVLHSRTASRDGLNALTAYNDKSFQHWLKYLHDTTPHL